MNDRITEEPNGEWRIKGQHRSVNRFIGDSVYRKSKKLTEYRMVIAKWYKKNQSGISA